MDIYSRFRLHASLSPRLSGGTGGSLPGKHADASRNKYDAQLQPETKKTISKADASPSNTDFKAN